MRHHIKSRTERWTEAERIKETAAVIAAPPKTRKAGKDRLERLVIPPFVNGAPRDEVVDVLRMWNYGDTKTFIAENCRMSVKKVTAILTADIPKEWRREAQERRHGG